MLVFISSPGEFIFCTLKVTLGYFIDFNVLRLNVFRINLFKVKCSFFFLKVVPTYNNHITWQF